MVQITIRDAGLFGYTVRRLTAIKDKPIYLLTVRIQVAIIVYKVVYGWLVGPGLVGPGCVLVVVAGCGFVALVVWLVVVVVVVVVFHF